MKEPGNTCYQQHLQPEYWNTPLAARLKYNDKFVPCQSGPGDEVFRNGVFEFNISKVIEFLDSDVSCVPLEEVQTCRFPAEFSSIDDSHLEFVSLDKPVIIAEIAPGRFNLIDGHHRMEKARRSGVETLPGYTLGVAHHVNFLTTREAYDAYVRYWNEKLQ